MKVLNLTANYFKPNLRILKNYVITFWENLIALYDLEGKLLDSIIFKNRIIVNIEIVNDNYMIAATSFSILIMKINFELLEFHEVFKYSTIKNIFFIKNKNLLLINSIDNIAIFDINNLNEKPIQVIYKDSFCNLIFYRNIFISYNYEYISLYQNIKGTKIYQLSSKLKLIGKKYITKLNRKILLIFLNNEILYSMNIKNLEITQMNLLFKIKNKRNMENEIFILSYSKLMEKYGKEDGFIYNNKNNIYIYAENILYYIKYIDNKFQFIKSFEINELGVINYMSNKYIKLNNLKINCISNFNFNLKRIFNLYMNSYFYKYDIIYYRPSNMINKVLSEDYCIKKELIRNDKKVIYIKKKIKNKFIKKKKANSKKIINHPKSFKKNYR